MDTKVLLLFIASFFVILSSTIASFSYRIPERFVVDSEQVNSVIQSQLISDAKNYLYMMNGFINFFTHGIETSPIHDSISRSSQVTNQILSFTKTFIDVYCSSVSANDAVRCNNLFIDYYSCLDPNIPGVYSRENQTTSSNTLAAAYPSHCQVRVLNHFYNFYKRAFTFDKIIVTKKTNSFELQVSSSALSSFVLSRPLMLSFGPYGLYRINYHIDSNSIAITKNPFEQFSSEQSGEYIIHLSLIPLSDQNRVPLYNNYSTFKLYPSTTNDIYDLYMANPEKMRMYPITAYYLNYNKPYNYIDPNPINTHNVLTFVLSSTYLANCGADTINIQLSSTSGINTLKAITMVQFDFAKTLNNIFNVKIGTTDIISEYSPHQDFVRAVTAFRSSETRMDHRYHIIVTIMFNTMYIVCLLQTSNRTQIPNDRCYMSRHHLKKDTQEFVLSYDNSAFESQLQFVPVVPDNNFKLHNEMKKYQTFTTTSSIPNYALMAKALGYYI